MFHGWVGVRRRCGSGPALADVLPGKCRKREGMDRMSLSIAVSSPVSTPR